MTDNRTIPLAEIPIGGKGGAVWNRLHGEREDICEALLQHSEPTSQAHYRQELLQTRLRSIDDALDRLISGSYGICSNCGCSIQDATLDVDPAWALCLDCGNRESNASRVSKNESELGDSAPRGDVLVENVNLFDTILVRTHNSVYRILLLDPKTGRALVEGGSYLLEPSEGLVKGSALPESAFKAGAICVGGRLEMWVNERVFLTSPIESVEVKHNAAAESLEIISAGITLMPMA
jgi:RNA polymerase-binding transcription factor DksA